MTFRFIYQPSEYYRIIPAINIEARGSIAVIKNQIGSVIKAYNDTEISKIQSDVLFYKIETTDGVLAGYFSVRIKVNIAVHAVLLQYQLRPSFNSFVTQISAQINTFINNGTWNQDYLS
jgi:hypothetical protein